MSVMQNAIELEGLRKRFGDTTALDGLDLVVPEAAVAGLLGPNGAGKTTAVRIISTLLRPDGGSARVLGADVVRDARRVRAAIGLTGQFSAVDEVLSGAENLRMIGRLFRLGARAARTRADELLAAFDLSEAAGRPVKTYSGGMRRRLDLAASLMARPRLLVLDEPTTGLDPRSRFAMWDVIAELRRSGTTVLLTTQYLEEADRLADFVAVIDHGRLLAGGTTGELKAKVGGERLEIVLGAAAGLTDAAEALVRHGAGRPAIDHEKAMVSVALGGSGLDDLPEILLELRRRELPVADVAVRRPQLDDVFLRLTGKPVARPENADNATGENAQADKPGKPAKADKPAKGRKAAKERKAAESGEHGRGEGAPPAAPRVGVTSGAGARTDQEPEGEGRD